MKEDLKSLDRLKEAFQSAESAMPALETCPAAEDLWDAQKGLLSRTQCHAVIDHTSRCGACANAWRLAMGMDPSESESYSGGTGAEVIRFRRMTPAVALAIAAVLVTAFAIQFQRQRSPIPPEVTYRDSLADQDIQSAIPNLATLPRNAFTLEWKYNISQSATFDVQVKTETLEPVASAFRLSEGRFTVPEENLANLPSGTRLFWQVVVRIDGEQLKWSPTFVNVLE